jgi:hypothetical protein
MATAADCATLPGRCPAESGVDASPAPHDARCGETWSGMGGMGASWPGIRACDPGAGRIAAVVDVTRPVQISKRPPD